MVTYSSKSQEWTSGLENALRRAEIEYAACNGGSVIPFLRDTYTQDREALIHKIGYKVEDKLKCEGEQWIVTTAGIYINIDTAFAICVYG